jgi:hypothetical protein
MRTQKNNRPWQHWICDDFLTQSCLEEVKSVPDQLPQTVPGRRRDSHRMFINEGSAVNYPHLYQLWLDMHDGAVRDYFEFHTQQSFEGLYPRVEVISDIGDFYLEPHLDHREKRLTAMVYTDHARLWPGTQLTHGHVVQARDNRCFFFVPDDDTWHGYPHTHFDRVRRCLQLNYWTYQA